MTLWQYFADAGTVVKCVMLILLAASVLSWTFIIQRAMIYNKRRNMLKKFKQKFWGGNDLSKMYQKIDAAEKQEGIEKLFHAAFKEYLKQRQSGKQTDCAISMKAINRAMDIAYAQEMEALEQNLPMLASIGSTMPYIGLFGTVWGIMTSFHALGHVQQATIAMVAPGISEALVATAMGLFAAIPAVLAYNRYSSVLEQLASSYATFQQEFESVLDHQGLLVKAEVIHD